MEKLENIKKITRLMDSQFLGPFGLRFGLDGLLGLIPFVGDFITNAISIYIISQATMMGCSASVLLRMGLNLLIENLLDLIPFFGNVFDFFWKANEKNLRLLELHSLNPKGATFESRLVLGGLAFGLIAMMAGSLTITLLLLEKLYQFVLLMFS
jgi:hypothetical protein